MTGARWVPTSPAPTTGCSSTLPAPGWARCAVRPGGVVAYVTCSPHLAETQLVASDVLKKRDDVERLDTAAAVRSVVGAGGATEEIPLSDRDDVQLWPHVHGTDAMHLTLLRRRG